GGGPAKRGEKPPRAGGRVGGAAGPRTAPTEWPAGATPRPRAAPTAPVGAGGDKPPPAAPAEMKPPPAPVGPKTPEGPSAPAPLPPRPLPALEGEPVAGHTAATLMPPLAVATRPGERGTAPPPEAAPAALPALPAAIDRVRRSQARYLGIAVEVRGGTVFLRAGDAREEDVMAFARELKRLKGVERVVLSD